MISYLKSIIRIMQRYGQKTCRLLSFPFRRGGLTSSNRLFEIDVSKPVYVFFAPESGIKSHFSAHCIIARTLRELGHQVLIVRCYDAYNHCLPIEMHQIPLNRSKYQKADICIACTETGYEMARKYNLPYVMIRDLLSENDNCEIKNIIEFMPQDVTNFEVNGVRFGTMCAIDLALLTKKLNQLDVSGVDREYLEAYIESALISHRAIKNLSSQLTIAGLLYFNEYSMLLSAAIAAMNEAIPIVRISYALHRNVDRSKIILMSDPLAIINYHSCLDQWEKWRVLPLPVETVRIISDNQLSRMGGTGHSVYSPKFTAGSASLFNFLGLDNKRKVLVAYTSSLDEYFSNIHLMTSLNIDLFRRDQPFKDQIDWISALVNYVESSQDLQLIVRIHPREGKTAREKVASEHGQMLAERFSQNYNHTHFIWPEEKISSYDLADLADLVLTSWSNISSETARMGIPTVMAFKRVNPFPVDDMVGWAATPNEYFSLIERTLKQPANLNTVIYAYRWSNLAFLSSYVDVSDLVLTHDYDGLPDYRLPAQSDLIERVICNGESLQTIKYNELVTLSDTEAVMAEISEIKCQLRRLVWFLIFGEQPAHDFDIEIGPFTSASNDGMKVEIANDQLIISVGRQKIISRSKITRRLIDLI